MLDVDTGYNLTQITDTLYSLLNFNVKISLNIFFLFTCNQTNHLRITLKLSLLNFLNNLLHCIL